jgi:signal transduction histidine kinase
LALFHLEKRNKYVELINDSNKKNSEEGIRTQLKLAEQTKVLQKSENEKLKSESIRQAQLRWFLIALSLLGLLSTFYVLKTNKNLKQKNEELARKFDEINAALLKGQTTERQRVAIDLHDNLGSTISSIKYSLEAIDRSKMNTDELAVQENLYSLLDKAYNDVRLLSHNLLPEEFEKQGLAETLAGFVRKMNKNSKIKFELEVSENFGRVDKKVEFELYSICLELVNNIIKHSKATEAMLRLRSATKGKISLTVSDNGIGVFNNDSDGRGLKNVQARVDAINGTWIVKAIDGEGVVNEILV